MKDTILGKAYLENYDSYSQFVNSEEGREWYKSLWSMYFCSRQSLKCHGIEYHKIYNNISYHEYYNDENRIVDPLKEFMEYENRFHLGFDILQRIEEIGVVIITYAKGGNKYYIVPDRFFRIVEYNTYEDYTQTQILQLRGSSYALANTDNLTIKAVKEDMAESEKELIELQKKIESVKTEKEESLAKLKSEIEQKMDDLEILKKEKLNELMVMKEQLNIQMAGLSQKVFQLSTEIYAIQCFFGDTVDFIRLKSGKSAPIETPVVLYQKVRYMDNELAKKMALKNVSFNQHELFEDFLIYSPEAEDIFYPDQKCITAVRVSETSTGYTNVYTDEGKRLNMLRSYAKFHGTKIGLIIRDGDNLFIGWTDDGKLTVKKDMFHSDELISESVEDTDILMRKTVSEKERQLEHAKHEGEYVPTPEQREIISRYFLFSILQGLIKREIICLPGDTSILEESRYVIFSKADNWIHTSKYGTFTEIIRKYSKDNRKGDPILTLMHIRDTTDYRRTWGTDDRSHNNSYKIGRASGCSVKDRTVYRINLIEDDNIYISIPSAASEWSGKDSKANFLLESDEFINLTFLNSLLIDSVISSEDLGGWEIGGRTIDYAYGTSYLWKAKSYLLKREAEALAFSLDLGIELASVPEWQIKLSDWMLDKDVRHISTYQIKRFLKSVGKLI